MHFANSVSLQVGQLTLISNKPRAATIRCTEPTPFATLDKNAYDKVFAKLEEMAINEKISFLKGLEVFQNWSRSAVSKLTFFLQERSFGRNHYVYKEGDACNYVYMVHQGEFEVRVRVHNKEFTHPKLF